MNTESPKGKTGAAPEEASPRLPGRGAGAARPVTKRGTPQVGNPRPPPSYDDIARILVTLLAKTYKPAQVQGYTGLSILECERILRLRNDLKKAGYETY